MDGVMSKCHFDVHAPVFSKIIVAADADGKVGVGGHPAIFDVGIRVETIQLIYVVSAGKYICEMEDVHRPTKKGILCYAESPL